MYNLGMYYVNISYKSPFPSQEKNICDMKRGCVGPKAKWEMCSKLLVQLGIQKSSA